MLVCRSPLPFADRSFATEPVRKVMQAKAVLALAIERVGVVQGAQFDAGDLSGLPYRVPPLHPFPGSSDFSGV